MKKTILSFFILLLFIGICRYSLALEKNETYSIGKVNVNSLNLRSGTDINFPIVSKLSKDDEVKIYGSIGDWYVIQSNNNQVGVVNSQYITINYEKEIIENNTTLSEDENKILNLINNKREENNLSPLLIDESIQNLARLKAADLVENNCFTHYSPNYGSPFEMLKNNSIKYKTASENIAGNSDVEKAVESWIRSDSHKKNILSKDYNYTGIGVVNSLTYGKIIVELFIGK